MAITIVGEPDRIHPVYNPTVYVLDSNNKNQFSFRYVVQIFPAGGATPIAELKIAPRIGDGLGYVDISKILQSQITWALNTSSTTFINADSNSVYNYDIRFGEEFVRAWTYNNYGSHSINGVAYTRLIQTVQTAPNQQFFGAVGASGIQVYSQVSTPTNDFRDALTGFFTILNILTPWEIVLSLPFIGPGTGVLGTVRFGDNRKLRTLNLANRTGRVGFNRAYSFASWPSYTQTQIIANNSNSEILTNAPDDFRIWEWQSLYWNFFDDKNNQVQSVIFENDGGDQFQVPTGGTGAFIKQVDVSPNATLSTISGTAPLVKSGTKWYEVWGTNVPCNDCQLINVINTGTGPFNLAVTPSGTFSGAPWYYWGTIAQDYVLFYDSSFASGWVVKSGITSPNLLTGTIIATWNGPIGSLTCPPIDGVPPGADWTGSAGFVFSTQLTSCAGQTTEKKRIYIDERCPINTTQLLFLDRAGSWSSFAFTLRTRETGTINRRTYLQELGNLVGSKWTYSREDVGSTTYHVDFSKQYTLNTDWLSDGMSEYFEELLTSPKIYVKFQESDLFWLSCTIVDTNYITERQKNKKLIRKTVTIKLANEDPINA